MEDVATAAGVSVATVSKVVNNRYGVSASTVAHVKKVIDDLGYVTSIGAQSLRSQKTNIVGVLVAEFEPFSSEILKGISNAVSETGYELLAYAGAVQGGASGWEHRSLTRLGGTLIDGAILVTPTVVARPVGFPVVAIDPHSGTSTVPTVGVDDVGGARMATEHLLELGHTRIGFMRGRDDLASSHLREQGFRAAMTGAGVEVDETLFVTGNYSPVGGAKAARTLLERDDRPTAIVGANDLMAIATLDVARGLGISVPEELSVVGFDNVPESALSTPPLTTVAQPLHEMGKRALGTLVRMLAGEDVPEEERYIHLPTRFVARQTTGPVPQR